MKDTLKFILSQIVDKNDEVKISEDVQDTKTVFTIEVHPDDMGKIIGKHGRIIRAIRDLIKLMAAKNNQYVDVTLKDDLKPV